MGKGAEDALSSSLSSLSLLLFSRERSVEESRGARKEGDEPGGSEGFGHGRGGILPIFGRILQRSTLVEYDLSRNMTESGERDRIVHAYAFGP